MKNKYLFFGGILAVGGSFFYFFKRQLELALDFGYDLKHFSVIELKSDYAIVATEIEVMNKSSFQIIIKEYDLNFSYKGNTLANTASDIPFTIPPDSSFVIDTEGRVDLKKSLSTLFPFIQTVLKKEPINIELNGFVKVSFLGITHTIKLENQTVNYSNNLLADLGLESSVDKIENKAATLLGKIGIKI